MDWYGIPRACVNIKNFTQVRIGDTLAPEIKYWHPDQPVFISTLILASLRPKVFWF